MQRRGKGRRQGYRAWGCVPARTPPSPWRAFQGQAGWGHVVDSGLHAWAMALRFSGSLGRGDPAHLEQLPLPLCVSCTRTAAFLGLWVTPKPPVSSTCRQQQGTSVSPGDLVQLTWPRLRGRGRVYSAPRQQLVLEQMTQLGHSPTWGSSRCSLSPRLSLPWCPFVILMKGQGPSWDQGYRVPRTNAGPPALPSEGQ